MAFPCKRRFWCNAPIQKVRWGHSILFYMAIACWCAHARVNNMGFPCCCEFVIVLHGIPMSRAFCMLFIVFTWETHMNGHKKKPSHMEKPCNFRNATITTWESHVGKACCKKLQYWHRIPCKCALFGPWAHRIPMSAVRGGGGFPGFQGSFTWNSHVGNCRKTEPHGIPHVKSF